MNKLKQKEEMTEEQIKEIDHMIALLKTIKSSIKKKENLSDKSCYMTPQNSSLKQITKAAANLNWQCMELDKEKTRFARLFKGSFLDISTGEKEYNPSGFHHYRG